jgi:hypothetical protein
MRYDLSGTNNKEQINGNECKGGITAHRTRYKKKMNNVKVQFVSGRER